jgi:hypothetical protein
MNDVSGFFTVVIPSRSYCIQTKNVTEGLLAKYHGLKVILVLDELPLEETGATVILLAKGIASKRNIASENIETPYISFIDSDAYALDNWLESAYERFQSDSSIGIIAGPNLPFPNEDVQQKYSCKATFSFLVSGKTSYQKRNGYSGYIDSAPSCNMHVKTSVYQGLQGMDEGLQTGEDLEFCFRALQSNLKIYFDDNVMVYHRNRRLKGFITQRFIWGYTLLEFGHAVKYKTGLLMFVPALTLTCAGVLILMNFFSPVYKNIIFGSTLVYLCVVFFESLRIQKTFVKSLILSFYIIMGNLIPGVGTLYYFFNKKLSINKIYKNDD